VLICASSNDNVTPVMEKLQRRLKPSNNNQEEELMLQHDLEMSEEDDLPFEFQALEVAVEAICTYLDAHTTELETAFYPALDMITSKVRDELEQILDNHHHMVNLCLSRKLVGTSPGSGFDAANPALSTTGLIKISCGVSRTSLAAVHGDENYVGELEMLLEVVK
ncbi:UNVERIFIED_CONTAM: Magnesium transporter MRS2-I, partial [Sesamum angustifolium]